MRRKSTRTNLDDVRIDLQLLDDGKVGLAKQGDQILHLIEDDDKVARVGAQVADKLTH